MDIKNIQNKKGNMNKMCLATIELKKIILLPCFCFFVYLAHCQQNSLVTNKYNSNSFFPAVTLENPISSGKLGNVIVGGVYENITRIARQPDANVGAYIGLGDPEKIIGAGVGINIYGLTNDHGRKDNIGEGSLNFHLNRFFLQKKLLLNLGVDNGVYWGGVQQNYITSQRSFYLSGNYLFYCKKDNPESPFSYVSVTAGIGNGYFRRDKNYTQYASGSFDPFGSVATPVFKGTNIIAEWNGYDIGTGISSIPYQKIPFVFTLEVTDLVFGSPRIIGSISLPFNFSKAGKTKPGLPVRPIGIQPVRSERTI